MDVLDRLVLEPDLDIAALAARTRHVDEMMVRSALSQLPPGGDQMAYRRRLRLYLAHREALRGDPTALEGLLRDAWQQGGDIIPWLEALLMQGRHEEATAFAAFELTRRPRCDGLRRVRRQAVRDPWLRALARFVAQPSAARWAVMVAAVPRERLYARVRRVTRLLADVGVDPVAVAESVAPCPVTAELLGVERGDVAATHDALDVQFLTPDERARLVLALAKRAWSRGDTGVVDKMVRLVYGQTDARSELPPRLVALFERIDHDLVETEITRRQRG